MWPTVLWYTLVGSVAAVPIILTGTMLSVLHVNDFPRKRRFCLSKKKLSGKTVLITGWHYNQKSIQHNKNDKLANFSELYDHLSIMHLQVVTPELVMKRQKTLLQEVLG